MFRKHILWQQFRKVVGSLNGTRWNRPSGHISVRIKIEDILHELIKGFEEFQVVPGLLLLLPFSKLLVWVIIQYQFLILMESILDTHPSGCLFRDSHTVAYSSCGICVYSRQYGAWPIDKNCCNLIPLDAANGWDRHQNRKETNSKKKKEQEKMNLTVYTTWLCISKLCMCL